MSGWWSTTSLQLVQISCRYGWWCFPRSCCVSLKYVLINLNNVLNLIFSVVHCFVMSIRAGITLHISWLAHSAPNDLVVVATTSWRSTNIGSDFVQPSGCHPKSGRARGRIPPVQWGRLFAYIILLVHTSRSFAPISLALQTIQGAKTVARLCRPGVGRLTSETTVVCIQSQSAVEISWAGSSCSSWSWWSSWWL